VQLLIPEQICKLSGHPGRAGGSYVGATAEGQSTTIHVRASQENGPIERNMSWASMRPFSSALAASVLASIVLVFTRSKQKIQNTVKRAVTRSSINWPLKKNV